MTDAKKSRILLVDDEPSLLDSLGRTLRAHFELTSTGNAEQALEAMRTKGAFDVIVSDLRMPGMDGLALLRKAREIQPEAVCILLTGHADLDAAINAVNSGAVFQFLTKPCPTEGLIQSLEAAVRQHHLITAEKVLLEQTLHGSIRALTEILSMTNPVAFGRANRVKAYIGHLAPQLGAQNQWELEIAAMLSQIGGIVVPNETLQKFYKEEGLTEPEKEMISRIPATSAKLLADIPRLEAVRETLLYQDKQWNGGGPPAGGVKGSDIPLGARLLKILLDYDLLESQSLPPKWAVNKMKERAGWYDPQILGVFSEFIDRTKEHSSVLELPLKALEVGMILEDDVVTRKHMMLIPRGSKLTHPLLERMQNFAKHHDIMEPIRIQDPAK